MVMLCSFADSIFIPAQDQGRGGHWAEKWLQAHARIFIFLQMRKKPWSPLTVPSLSAHHQYFLERFHCSSFDGFCLESFYCTVDRSWVSFQEDSCENVCSAWHMTEIMIIYHSIMCGYGICEPAHKKCMLFVSIDNVVFATWLLYEIVKLTGGYFSVIVRLTGW